MPPNILEAKRACPLGPSLGRDWAVKHPEIDRNAPKGTETRLGCFAWSQPIFLVGVDGLEPPTPAL